MLPSMQPFNTPHSFPSRQKTLVTATKQCSCHCTRAWMLAKRRRLWSIMRSLFWQIRGKVLLSWCLPLSCLRKNYPCGWKTKSTELCLPVLVEKCPQLKSLQSTIRWDHRSETCLPTENTLSLLQSDKQCSTLLDVCCGFYTLLITCSGKTVKWEKTARLSESDSGEKRSFSPWGRMSVWQTVCTPKRGYPGCDSAPWSGLSCPSAALQSLEGQKKNRSTQRGLNPGTVFRPQSSIWLFELNWLLSRMSLKSVHILMK